MPMPHIQQRWNFNPQSWSRKLPKKHPISPKLIKKKGTVLIVTLLIYAFSFIKDAQIIGLKGTTAVHQLFKGIKALTELFCKTYFLVSNVAAVLTMGKKTHS